VPLKVLIVDDSALMRRHLTQLFQVNGFEVGVARTGQEAVEQVLAFRPDVVTLDVNMPGMDGLTALSLIMAARPTPVVMVSSLTTKGASATLEALAMGAIDYVAKPGGTISLSIEDVAEELISKVRVAARARVKQPTRPPMNDLVAGEEKPHLAADSKTKALPKGVQAQGLVLIGVSTGGPRTLEDILPQFNTDFPWPILVAQHMPAAFTASFAARLDHLCPLPVKEVSRTEEIEPGTIYIGRGGTDLVIGRRGERLVASAKPESPHHLWHPSVTLLVESAMAHVPPERLIGVQLTGMGDDGAEAMAKLKRAGGRTIAESEDSAVVFGMPGELIARGGASTVLPAPKIASQIMRWVV
jgi:two-component system chemotaxis response regulator CheB